MNKAQMIKAQGKVATKGIHGTAAALVLDTTSLYYERSSWGKPVRFHKTSQTVTKQNRLGIVETGWLVMQVSTFSYSPDIKARVAKAEAFIANFTGTLADVLNSDGSVNHDVVPSDVIVSLFNIRNLVERAVQAAPEPVRTVEADGVKLVEDERLVVRVTVAEGITFPWLRADNAAKAYAKAHGNGAKLVRVHNTDNAEFVYNWSA